ncbi:MAG: methionyl-tRNA formyltransferase, partial [Acidimicrobiia bacterium]
ISSGGMHPTKQNEALASKAPKLQPEDARIDWSMTTDEIVNRVRAFNPRPGAWTMWQGKRLKIYKATSSSDMSTGDIGTLDVLDERVLVDTGGERISLEEVQPEGAKRIAAGEFVRGYRPASGDRLE